MAQYQILPKYGKSILQVRCAVIADNDMLTLCRLSDVSSTDPNSIAELPQQRAWGL